MLVSLVSTDELDETMTCYGVSRSRRWRPLDHGIRGGLFDWE
jgi:hypothetical protein